MTTTRKSDNPESSGESDVTVAAEPSPPNPRKAPRPTRTAATKQKLFDAALTLLANRGIASVTVDEIAAAAGVAKGTVYYNFGSKDNLVDALFRHGVQLLETRLRTADDVPDPDHAMEKLIESAVDFFADYPAFTQLLVSELWRTPGQWHETLATLRERIVWVFRDQIRRLADAGRLPAAVDVKTVSAAVFGSMLVLVLDWQVFDPTRDKEQVRAAVLSTLRGLTTDPTGPHAR